MLALPRGRTPSKQEFLNEGEGEEVEAQAGLRDQAGLELHLQMGVGSSWRKGSPGQDTGTKL